MDLWEVVRPFIEGGIESRKVDLKLLLDLSKPARRAEFAKDVTAMANTSGGRGYLIIGVKDEKDRKTNSPEDYVAGWRPLNFRLFEQQMVQALNDFCDPVPEVEYREILHPSVPDRPISVIIIPRSFQRPYRVVNPPGKLGEGCYIRRGSHTYPVKGAEVLSTRPVIVINFGRKIDAEQHTQIEGMLDATIEEIIDVAYQLNDAEPHAPQVLDLISSVGLTEDEWAGLPLVVNTHPFAPDSAAILACIHGLRGSFPTVIRMAKNLVSTQFNVVELFDLQTLRNTSRGRAASL